MSNLIHFMADTSKSASPAQATPFGIKIGHKVLGYSVAIRQLDEGRFDECLIDGMRFLVEVFQGERRGWFKPTMEQRAITWRWVVATVFIGEQWEENGTVEVPQNDGTTKHAVRYVGRHGGITVYPATERFSLANHVEEAALERYPRDNPYLKALQIYQSMVEVNPDNGAWRLSQWGREGLALIHDGFIDMLNTEGMPAAPIAH
ncbi:hypothetical protein GTU79_08820 [Sodalis ligni]|uniref:hypothetical protein n=1 Tax=Sodalis ligni TaxID=2697027 RepID=UPI00193F39CD|nr:hypothetical protein [Sodalis ligni]QWA12776.1 hypothetical protein GTU79_08820 [Sodalis ligni]